MHVSGQQLMYMIVGALVVGILLLALAKAGIFAKIGNGTYYFDFANALDTDNETF